MKLVTVIGARPQFIKAAVISRVISNYPEIEEKIIHTGQHFDVNMSDIFFEQMCIPKPDYNLNIHGLNHGAMTGEMLKEIEKILLKEHPDYVLVYGDTNSTLAGALAASKLHIKIAHIEAGLRSFNMDMPEEINRILTDRISNLLFCPTLQAIENLKAEGFHHFNCRMIQSGDVMQDAALFYANQAQQPRENLPEKFVLATIHRAENTDVPMQLFELFQTLEDIAKETGVVVPLHPRTRQKLQKTGFDTDHSRICFIPPVGYLEMVYLLQNCSLVMTDSGGVQKEAYFFGKYCITLRTETEWIELVENGFNIVTGTNKKNILDSYYILSGKTSTGFSKQLYGDGHSGEKIITELFQAYKNEDRA